MSEWFPKTALGTLPAVAARRWGTDEALMFGGERWSYADFDREVDRHARALIASGIERGDRVALWLGNRPEFLFLFFAIVKIGAVAVPLNTRYRSLELDHALRHSECTALVTTARSGPVDHVAILRDVVTDHSGTRPDGSACDAALQERFPSLTRVVLIEPGDLAGATEWESFLDAGDGVAAGDLALRAAQVDPDGPAVISYTSGTTGASKGVLLSHRVVRQATERSAILGVTQSDVLLNYLPVFHSFGLCFVALHCVLNGAKQVLMETFDADAAIALIDAERVTVLHGFDTHFRDLIAAKRRSASCDLGSLRVGVLASGPEAVIAVAEETARELCPTVSVYGTTETSTAIAITPLDGSAEQRTHASGYPLPGVELRVVDPATGSDVAAGVEGEILVRHYAMMLGYHRQPDATREVLDEQGWFHTGDIGVLRADGHIRFVGRYKDMLKVGGENVSPAEVESLLMSLPGVVDVAVVGRPHPRLYEVPVAFVVCEPGVTVSLDDVHAFCMGKLARYKLPQLVVATEALPYTSSGKIMKHVLRQSLSDIAEVSG